MSIQQLYQEAQRIRQMAEELRERAELLLKRTSDINEPPPVKQRIILKKHHGRIIQRVA